VSAAAGETGGTQRYVVAGSHSRSRSRSRQGPRLCWAGYVFPRSCAHLLRDVACPVTSCGRTDALSC
jgi:hypothetical protein